LSDDSEEILVEHSSNPSNTEPLKVKPTHEAFVENPSCGDELKLELLVNDTQIEGVCIKPHGCAVSKASASLCSEFVLGKHLSEVDELAKLLAEGLKTGDFSEKLGDLSALKSLSDFPMRHRCVLMPWEALAKLVD